MSAVGIDINLLPQRKTKFSKDLLIYLVLFMVWLSAASYFGVSYYLTKQEIVLLNKEVQEQEKVLANAEQRVTQGNTSNSLQSYLDLSNKLQHLFYPTTLMLDELARNLPKNGKLGQVTYNSDGKITLQGKFEQYDDVAAYLHNLQKSDRVVKASVKTIAAAPIEWKGPVDEAGNPMSPSLQIVGGELLPRYEATFEVLAVTIDAKSIEAAQKTTPEQSGSPAATTKQ